MAENKTNEVKEVNEANAAATPVKSESKPKKSTSSKKTGSKSSSNSRSAASNRTAASSRSGSGSRSSSSRSNSRGGSGNRNSGGSRRSSAATANKKFMQSPIAIACYVFAALMLVYACYQAGSTIDQINQYYMSMGTQARPIEYILYVPQAMLGSLVNAFIFFMGGYILNAVRKLDPKNYKSETEIKKEKAAKEAKKAEKEAAKAAVKEPAKTTKESFEESLEAELKKSEDKADN